MSTSQEASIDAERAVRIFVNNRPVALKGDSATGAAIKAAADIPTNFHLYGPEGEPIGDNQRVRLHDGEHFTAISGHDVS